MPEAISQNAAPSSTASAPATVDSAPPSPSSSAVTGSGGPGADSAAPPDTQPSKPVAVAQPLPDKAIEPLPKFPTPDEVDWDKWDGLANSLPEQIRPWHERFDGRHKKALTDAQKQVDSYKSLYEALSFSEEDPRIADLTGKVTGYETELGTLRSQIAEFERLEDERISAEARADVDRFWSENQDIKADQALQTKLSTLVSEGWNFRDAAKILKMPDDIQAWASEQRKAGVPEAKVVEFAEERLKFRRPQAPKPRPSAELVSGNGPTSRPAVEEKEAPLDLSSAESFENWRNEKVRRSLAKAQGH